MVLSSVWQVESMRIIIELSDNPTEWERTEYRVVEERTDKHYEHTAIPVPLSFILHEAMILLLRSTYFRGNLVIK